MCLHSNFVGRGDDGLFDEGNEDCLFLNVYVSAAARQEQKNAGLALPVAIFVHGECVSECVRK